MPRPPARQAQAGRQVGQHPFAHLEGARQARPTRHGAHADPGKSGLSHLTQAAACRVLPRCGALLLSAVLAGCGTAEKLGLKEPTSKDVLQLEVQAPKPLDKLLERHLNLARVNRQARGETLNDGELERLVALAPAQARELLETEGYFHADVRTTIEPGDPPRVRVQVQPGPRVVVASAQFDLQGAAQADAERGQPQALAARRGLREDWPLPAGEPFRDDDWSSAKAVSVARFRAQAYVGAQWLQTQGRINVATNRAALSGTLDSGPLYRAGPLNVRGLNHHDAQTVQNIADYELGIPATEDFLLDFQQRLQQSGLFERATVTLPPSVDDPANTTVEVRLTERKLQEATVGVGHSANVGAKVSLEHVHYRPFGYAATARNKFDIAQLRMQWEGELSTHTLPGLYRNLVGGAASREESDTDIVSSARVRLGRAQETQRISRLLFAEAERSLTRNAAGKQGSTALALHFHGIWRSLDDNLLPTTGHAWTGQFGAGQARSDPGGSGPFTRLYARLNVYRKLGAWYGQGRVELGQVIARGDVVVPEPLRFRAGGDESVRGYKYRSLAPTKNGVMVGGKVLFTASAEVARPFIDRLPDLMGAVFVDAGRAAQSWSDLRPAVGYGVGVRYGSPVGQLKLDLGWGHETKQARLHLTVGVPF